jgi:8-oxo-dGTP diphosphatase
MLCGASCHNTDELAQAAELGLDFVLLSPVMRTLSHPETVPLGWQQFFHMVGGYSLPVYALGGLRLSDMQSAWTHGAHGIAMQRALWEQ